MGFPQPARADYCGKPSIDPRPFGSTIRDSGHLAGTPAARWSGTEPAISRRHGCVEAVVKPVEEGAHVYQHLNRCSGWEGPRKKGQGFKPDLGNLAVRHYRGLCQEDEKSSCCTKDGGRPSGAALWEEASNSRELLQPKAAVVNVHG